MTSVLRYVPVLKWRQGEYQALSQLSGSQKAQISPLVEVTPPGFDFELRVTRKNIDEHLQNFSSRMATKWGKIPIFVDTILIDSKNIRMANRQTPTGWLLEQARKEGLKLIPVTSFSRHEQHYTEIRNANTQDKLGAAIRFSLEDLSDEDFDEKVIILTSKLGLLVEETDIILDLRAPNFDFIDKLAEIVGKYALKSRCFLESRSNTIIATSFPPTLAGIRTPSQTIKRKEWNLYKLLKNNNALSSIQLQFGDYAIASPDLVEIDMRLLKPSANIRYCTDDCWLIAKGKNVRDNGYAQYRELCTEIVDSNAKLYLGREFSEGSKYIFDCKEGLATTGNLSTWRRVGTNQHLVKVITDLANFDVALAFA